MTNHTRYRETECRMRRMSTGTRLGVRHSPLLVGHFPQAAFTLMELVIVIVLIGIMAAIIVPEMKGAFEDALLRSSGRKLVDVFTSANSRAISFNQTHRVRLDQGSGKYVVERATDDSKGPRDFEPVTDLSGLKGEIDSRIAIAIQPLTQSPPEDSDEAENSRFLRDGIHFYSDGTSDGCEIVLRDRAGFKLVLRLDPITCAVDLPDNEEP